MAIDKEEIFEYLKENLRIEASFNGSFTDPNMLSVELVLEGETISEVDVYIRIKPEYES